jgi:dinuclear metal center YbgI/SA1388 family protein
MLIHEIIKVLEDFAPLQLQESYDNAGLITGNPAWEATGAILCLDSTEDVVDEAIKKKCNFIIAHHPIAFSGLKKITGKNYIERVIIKAIKNDIAIYAAHTNYDNVRQGVNFKIAEKLNLQDVKVLVPKPGLKKLVTFVPQDHLQKVRESIFYAGAGHIGNYDQCSFSSSGKGTFRGLEGTNPFIGEQGKLSEEAEIKMETIFPAHNQNKIISALLKAHPYEEVAYDIYSLDNLNPMIGAGAIGILPEEKSEEQFLEDIQLAMKAKLIRHTRLLNKKVKKVAFCGGSGSFLLGNAISAGADFFITADFKYHQFFDADNKIVVADIGHYESEQFTSELFYNSIIKIFPKFALYFSEINTNPINYYYKNGKNKK